MNWLKNPKTWLVVSLCVNLLLIGVFVGGVSHARKAPPPMVRDEFTAVFRAASPEMRARLHEEFMGMHDARPELDPRARLERFVALIEAPTLDEAALSAFFKSARDGNAKIAQAGHDRLIATLSEMSAEERQALAERIKSMPKGRFGDRDGRKVGGKHDKDDHH